MGAVFKAALRATTKPAEELIGAARLEFAVNYDALRQCGMYFATKSWTEMMQVESKKAP
jgi:hypothetical protein